MTFSCSVVPPRMDSQCLPILLPSSKRLIPSAASFASYCLPLRRRLYGLSSP